MPVHRVTVFGGSQIRTGEPAYKEALSLGRLLGGAGYTVLTGGYMGTMEAVSRGAKEAGGHVIGVTCDEIERWRPVKANPWVQEERRCSTLWERMFTLIENCDAALALSGGPGTLAEISLMWNLLLIGAIPRRPLILIGSGWQSVMQAFFTAFDGYVPENQRRWLEFAPDVENAVQYLQREPQSKI